jgi:(S)-ureidoglycine aminohydrolase
MHNLGQTRSTNRRDHLLHTPDTFVRTPLPGLTGGLAIVHIAPALGAQFTQYTAEIEAGGTLAPTAPQRFLYLLEGEATLLEPNIWPYTLQPGDYAYLPPGAPYTLHATTACRVAVIEKPYIPLPDGTPPPSLLTGSEPDIPPTPLMGDPDLQVRALLPAGPAFDFAVNTMTYQPGAALAMVEVHVMEHGLLMLEGGGIYRLSDAWYPTTTGDFIWMAPFCPQWFGAIGKVPAKYLIYKDFNRFPLA